MLNKISIENFYSIGKKQSISFLTSKKDSSLNSVALELGSYLNLVSCLVGHNASGKTSILKAISFIFWMMCDSYTSMKAGQNLPSSAHKFHNKKATEISIEITNKITLYKYVLKVKNNKIIHEYLGKHIERGFSRIFEYTRIKEDWDFNSVIDINSSDLNRFKNRDNVSVISSLIETGYLQELDFVKKCESNVTNLGMHSMHPFISFFETSKKLHDNETLLEHSKVFLKDIDIGISGFQFGNAILRQVSNEKEEEPEVQKILECLHEVPNRKFKLPLIEESNGTRHSLKILTEIIPILSSGGLVVIDEIESGLHPYVAKKIISLFESKETNPLNAQIIFSTHQHLLMNDRSKSQIFITAKSNNNLETEIYRLDEIEGVRNDENFFNKYLAGTYGGIPIINWSN